MTHEPPDHRPAGAGRAGRAGPTRLDVDEEIQKVAPWQEWTAVTLDPTNGDGEPPVRFTVSGLDDDKNAYYSKLITSAAHEHFKIAEPGEGAGLAAYLVDGGL